MKLYFKLKHDIQNNSELPLAKMEVEALLNTKVKEVKNFVDVLAKPPLVYFLDREGWRIQDIMTRMTYTGELQGFFAEIPIRKIKELVERLSYFRDFFIFLESPDEIEYIQNIYPELNLQQIEFETSIKRYKVTPFLQIFVSKNMTNEKMILLRFIPLHTIYEASDFILSLSQNEKHVNRMFEESLIHFQDNFYEPYLAESVRLFKGISDFIDDRRAPQQYLTHYYFGIRAKFFPRMIRAILNTIKVEKEDLVLDPMTGCGTLNVETSLLGINSIGTDINPLFVLISKVKVESMRYPIDELRKEINTLLLNIKSAISGLNSIEPAEINLPARISKNINESNKRTVGIIKKCIENSAECFRDFFKLPLAYYTRTMLRNYSPEKTYQQYSNLLWKMFFALVYLQRFIKEVYPLQIAEAKIFTEDVRLLSTSDKFKNALKYFNKEKVDHIITSPPYGTAIDYVLDHAHSIHVLDELEGNKDYTMIDANTIGSPRYKERDLREIKDFSEAILYEIEKIPKDKKPSYIKYFLDMIKAFDEMYKVLEQEGYLILIIGKEQPMGKEILQLGKIIEILGSRKFDIEKILDINLQKASVRGNITTEHIIFFRKRF
jgi:tRNA G10  N-methylase Trm11